MKIHGLLFRKILQAGFEALVRMESEVNAINVFPVADRDTGSNLVQTLGPAVQALPETPHLGNLLVALEDPLLESAQGNAGLIFAAYLLGAAQDLAGETAVSASRFAETLRKCAAQARTAVAEPKEGTILTTMSAFAEGFAQEVREGGDVPDAWVRGLEQAKQALAETQEVLPVLKEAGVVDAGALGFVTWLEGGLHALLEASPKVEVQALLLNATGTSEIQHLLQQWGTSVVVISVDTRTRIHVHTAVPRAVLRHLVRHGILDRYEITPLPSDQSSSA